MQIADQKPIRVRLRFDPVDDVYSFLVDLAPYPKRVSQKVQFFLELGLKKSAILDSIDIEPQDVAANGQQIRTRLRFFPGEAIYSSLAQYGGNTIAMHKRINFLLSVGLRRSKALDLPYQMNPPDRSPMVAPAYSMPDKGKSGGNSDHSAAIDSKRDRVDTSFLILD
jgi:hypothetical protein